MVGVDGLVLPISAPLLSNKLLFTVCRKFLQLNSISGPQGANGNGPGLVTTIVVVPSGESVVVEGAGLGCGWGCCASRIFADRYKLARIRVCALIIIPPFGRMCLLVAKASPSTLAEAFWDPARRGIRRYFRAGWWWDTPPSGRASRCRSE